MNTTADFKDGADALLKLHPDDNVAIARAPLDPETPWSGTDRPQPVEQIRRGHKMALAPIAAGASVRKFGQVIGVATRDIAPGAWVHTQNMGFTEVSLDYAIGAEARALAPAAALATFQGYHRPDGRVGTRNFIAIISSVNCSATVSKRIAAHFSRPGGLDQWPNIDGVIALTHGGGCALDMRSEGYRLLTRTIAGYAAHPNVGGVLMVGLGCEINQIPELLRRQGLAESDRLATFTIQDTGGTRAAVNQGIAALESMADLVNQTARAPAPASDLMLGLQCGGSDAYSGVTANPALGHASDLLVAQGGTALLAETPEVYGAEHLLTRRAVSEDVAQKLLDRIDWWRDYTAMHGAEMDNNPSYGNKQGGLTTILEKSLGAVAKAGSAPLSDVVRYAEQVTAKGFVFMDSPGYDPVSVTGQIASGCNLVAFTTGRGSVSGFKPVPTIKLATNDQMYARMSDDMDINCGEIASGHQTVESSGQQIFDYLMAVASGQETKSETLDYGDNEFVPWHIGAVM